MRFKTLIFLVILLFLENLVKGGWVDFKNRVYCTVTFGRHVSIFGEIENKEK